VHKKYVIEYSRCGAPGGTLNAPKPNETPNWMRGNKDEAMKINHVSLCENRISPPYALKGLKFIKLGLRHARGDKHAQEA